MAFWDNIQARYNLGSEIAIAPDSSTNKYNLTRSNSARTDGRGGLVGSANLFNGTSDLFYTVSIPANLQFTGDFTICGWFYRDSATATSDEVIAGLWDETSGAEECAYRIYISSVDNKLKFGVSSTGGKTETGIVSSVSAVPATTWYFFVATHDAVNDELKIYLNAYNDTSLTLQNTTAYSAGVYAADAALMIGASEDTTHSNYYAGRIDDLCFFSEVKYSTELEELLTAEDNFLSDSGIWSDVQARWRLNDPDDQIDDSGFDMALENYSGCIPATGFSGGADSAIQFVDGNLDTCFRSAALDRDALRITGAMTISGWFKPLRSTRVFAECLVCMWGGDTGNKGYMIYIPNATNKLTVVTSTDGVTTDFSIASDNIVTYNVWQHFCFVYDGPTIGTGTLYIDNVAQANTFTNNTGHFGSNAAFFMGRGFDAGTTYFGFDGLMDDVQISAKAFSSDERTELYSGTADDFLITPVTSGPSISVDSSSVHSYQIIQRTGTGNGTADINISGLHSGTVTEIEASFDGSAFTTIDAAPNINGTFSGTLTGLTGGSQGDLIVRFKNNTSISVTIETVGIGDIFVVAGQSNAVGIMTNKQTWSHATLVACMYRDDNSGWEVLSDPTDYEREGETLQGSIWPLVAEALMDKYDVPVGFITTAFSGSGLTVGVNRWNNTVGAPYTTFKDTMAAANPNAITGLIFIHGETDAANGVVWWAYRNALAILQNRMQTDTGLTIDMMISQVGDFQIDTTEDDIQDIRRGQWDAARLNSEILYGPCLYDIDIADDTHYTSDAEGLAFANRIVYCLEQNFYDGGNSPRGPQYLNSTYFENKVVVNFTVGKPPLQGAGTVGWRVSDSSGTLTVTNVVVLGNSSVLITVNRDLTTTVYVTWAYGFDGEGTAFRDSADCAQIIPTNYGLPVESFSPEEAQLVRSLQANMTGVSETPDIDANITRSFQASMSGISVTPEIHMPVTRSFQASMAGISLTPNISVSITRSLQANMAAISETPIISYGLTRFFTASMHGVSITPDDILATVASIRSFMASMQGRSETPTIPISIKRSLIANMAGVSVTPDDVIHAIAGVRSFRTNMAGISVTPDDIYRIIERTLSANMAGISVTPNDVVGVSGSIKSFLANMAGISATPDDADITINRKLSVSMAALSATPDISVEIERILNANMSGVSLTPDDVGYMLSLIGNIFSPSVSLNAVERSVSINTVSRTVQ